MVGYILSISLHCPHRSATEHSHGCRSRSKERSISTIDRQQEIEEFSSSLYDPNQYNSPVSSHPILNRVREQQQATHDHRNSEMNTGRTDEKVNRVQRRNSKGPEEKTRSTSRGRNVTTNWKSKEITRQSHSPSSARNHHPAVPPPSVFLRPKSSKPASKEDVLLVLPVQYTLPSETATNSYTSVQHGVVVLHSSATLRELTSRLQDQFDLPESFDIILSQRNLENTNYSGTSPVVQVTSPSPHLFISLLYFR
jgi:hypothetical protein